MIKKELLTEEPYTGTIESGKFQVDYTGAQDVMCNIITILFRAGLGLIGLSGINL